MEKVVYKGDRETYHPRLGLLVPNQPFELEEETAERYVKSGLLEKYTEPEEAERKKMDDRSQILDDSQQTTEEKRLTSTI